MAPSWNGIQARCCWGAWVFPAAAYAALSKNCLLATLTNQVLSLLSYVLSVPLSDKVARLKVCTKPLGGVGVGGGSLSQQKPALGAPPQAQPSYTSKILAASSFRPVGEESL